MNDHIHTDLADVGGMSLTDLRRADLDADIAEQVKRVVGQVAKPRRNLGSSGPPGRVD